MSTSVIFQRIRLWYRDLKEGQKEVLVRLLASIFLPSIILASDLALDKGELMHSLIATGLMSYIAIKFIIDGWKREDRVTIFRKEVQEGIEISKRDIRKEIKLLNNKINEQKQILRESNNHIQTSLDLHKITRNISKTGDQHLRHMTYKSIENIYNRVNVDKKSDGEYVSITGFKDSLVLYDELWKALRDINQNEKNIVVRATHAKSSDIWKGRVFERLIRYHEDITVNKGSIFRIFISFDSNHSDLDLILPAMRSMSYAGARVAYVYIDESDYGYSSSHSHDVLLASSAQESIYSAEWENKKEDKRRINGCIVSNNIADYDERSRSWDYVLSRLNNIDYENYKSKKIRRNLVELNNYKNDFNLEYKKHLLDLNNLS